MLLAAAGLVAVVTQGSDNPSAASALPQTPTSANSLDLTGTDPVTGRQVSLASFIGKPIVLNIWGAWCKSYAEARALAQFEQAHPEAQVVGIDVQDSKADAKAFYRSVGWTHPSIYDAAGQLAARLHIQAVPTTIFLDRHHRIVTRITGDTNLAGFTEGLHQAKTRHP